MARTLGGLFRYLDRLPGRAPLRELAAELAELDISAEDVAAFVRFGDGGYRRNLVRAGEWYNVWVLCWKNGQRSPIHDHAGSSCGLRVLRGTATVTRFVFTPNGLFFVRNHFQEPSIDKDRWGLRVEGLVRRPHDWTWAELTALPERSVFATVECAGNGRSFLQTPVPGVQWGAGAIGHAEWTGVPLCRVLEQSGLDPGALEVIFEGSDRGSESDHPEPMSFARSLPL